jgi:quercetin dioxygenase-like cupin family protein
MKRLELGALPDVPIAHHPDIRKRVLLASGDVPHVAQLARARLEPGQVAAGHAHGGMWEIFVVEQGEGVMRVDGVSQTLAPGTCVVVEPGEVHELEAVGARTLVLLYFGIVA